MDTPERGPERVQPASGARSVPLNSPIRVRYSAGYFEPGGPGAFPEELIRVHRCGGSGCDSISCDMSRDPVVPGRVQVAGDELIFLPDRELETGATYAGIAYGIDLDLSFNFCTVNSGGILRDSGPPIFPAARFSELTSTAAPASCELPDGGYRIAAFFQPADDPDGPPGSIEYLLHVTRAEGLEAPELRSRISNFGTGGDGDITMAFVIGREEAQVPVCVTVHAVDGLGHVDETGIDGCIDPIQGYFFQPLCSVGEGVGLAGSGAGKGIALPLFALFGSLLFLRGECRRRRRRGRGAG